MASTKVPGPLEHDHRYRVPPSRTPGSLGMNDQGDPSVMTLLGDTPGPSGIDFHSPRYIRARSNPTTALTPSANNQLGQMDSHGTAPIVGTGVASVTRIPVPGTQFFVELSPRGWTPPGGSTSALFIQDRTGGRVLRLDFGYNKATGMEDYHWNQKGTFADFGIGDHTSAGPAGEGLFKAAKFLKYGGRVLLIVGIAMDVYSIVEAKKRWRQVLRVAGGWGGAEAGAVIVGEWGAELGSVEPGGGTAAGGIAGGIVGGIFGYFGASWAIGRTYDWVEETYFAPLRLTVSPEQ
jgi:hypothetical protein